MINTYLIKFFWNGYLRSPLKQVAFKRQHIKKMKKKTFINEFFQLLFQTNYWSVADEEILVGRDSVVNVMNYL